MLTEVGSRKAERIIAPAIDDLPRHSLPAGARVSLQSEAKGLRASAGEATVARFCIHEDGSLRGKRRVRVAAAGPSLQKLHGTVGLAMAQETIDGNAGTQLYPTRACFLYYEPGDYALLHHDVSQCTVTLLACIEGSADPKLREFSVRVEASEAGYHTVMVYKYSATFSKYVVALTTNPLVVQTMCLARAVTETMVVPPGTTNLAPNENDSRATIVGVAHGADGTPGGSRSPLRFRTVPERRRRALLRDAGIAQDVEDCVLYEANPAVDLNMETGSKAEYIVKYRTQEALPFTFWVNDRPLHVRAIEIDLSALGRAKYERAQVHLFAGLIGWAATVQEDDGRWLFPIDNWLLAGQGVVVAWPAD